MTHVIFICDAQLLWLQRIHWSKDLSLYALTYVAIQTHINALLDYMRCRCFTRVFLQTCTAKQKSVYYLTFRLL